MNGLRRVSLALVEQIKMDAIREFSCLARTDEMGHIHARLMQRPAIDDSDDADTNDESFQELFSTNKTMFSFLCFPRFRFNASTENGLPWEGKICLAPLEINLCQLV